MTVHELVEYGSSEPIRLGAGQRRALTRMAGGRLTLLAGPDESTVVVKATSYVGAVSLPGLTLRIRPKVPLANLFSLFTVGLDQRDWSHELAGWAETELVEGLAEVLIRAVDVGTSRGMLHGYREVEERVPAVRGRLLIDQLVKRPWELTPAPCRFDDFTLDTIENRILRYVVREILTWPLLDFATRRRGRRLVERFEGVGDVAAAEALSNWPEITRLNEHLSVPLTLARLVLANAGLSDASGERDAHGFLVDMNELYERWVAIELARRLAPEVTTAAQESSYLARGGQIPMRPDLVFRWNGEIKVVGDTKYKLTTSGFARGNDYYQLLAYAVAHQTDKGLLIYCSGDVQPHRSVTVRHLGQDLICYRLPLSGEPRDLARRMDDLADYVRDLV